ncbi:MAG: hypothetical protein IIA83_05645 [Thaumarchaeota archaeon]|nr:hypothetical protein [Nitrososphaerota archaeon]
MKPVVIIAIAFVVLFALMPITGLAFGESIPKWVKNIFVWYAEDKIEEGELLSALQYLIDSRIIITSGGNQIARNYVASIEAHPVKDNGDFYVTYYENPNSVYEFSAKEWIQEVEYFETQIQFLNSNFRLPYDVEIIVEECNEENAFYDYQAKQIIMCYEFFDGVFDDFATFYDTGGVEYTDDDLSMANLDVVDWIFYHEVGHAFVDIYLLPITGLEENVVDQFASYIMLVETDFGGDENTEYWIQDIMYNVGTWFLIQATSGYENVYWDVHNLDIQRFYNVSCYAYGSNPEYNYDLITDGWLPQERANNCEYEYSVLEDSWTRLLAPYRI